MKALRHVALLHRLVLAWFVLSLGVAVAAPVVHPQAVELVCSSVGMVKLIVHTDDGAQDVGQAGSAMDCPLCTLGGVPPAIVSFKIAMPLPLGRSLQSIPAARLAAATASPLPARGPPARA